MKGLTKGFHTRVQVFTLVELLVVIAILAILVAVVVPNFTGLIGKGELQTYNAEKKTVQTIIDAYMADSRVSVITASTVQHTAIPSAEFCATCTGIATYFRQATKWCWSVSTTGLVVKPTLAAATAAGACGATAPPAAPDGPYV